MLNSPSVFHHVLKAVHRITHLAAGVSVMSPGTVDISAAGPRAPGQV